MRDLEKRCPLCRVNQLFCFCDQVKSYSNITKVSMLVHVRELSLASNTAHLVNRVLSNSEILIRGQMDSPLQLDGVIDANCRPLFLFPDESAQVLDEQFVKNNPGPYQLIVPDGSWRQAKKFKKREKILASIPSVKLESARPSEYILRKEPSPTSLCTFEAIARALGILESPSLQLKMEEVFTVMVDTVMRSRKGYVEIGERYRAYLEKKSNIS